MSPIEVMARALCWSNGMDPNLTLGGDGVNFLWHEYTHQAEAALKALSQMEPTPGMVKAVKPILYNGPSLYAPKYETTHNIWSAMLAAAVKEGKNG